MSHPHGQWPNGLLLVASALGIMGAAPMTTVAAPKGTPEPPCEACHGAHGEGIAAAHIPRLAGQSAEYLQKQLDDYASGARDNPIMRNFAKVLSEARRAELAERFAGMTSAYVQEAVAPTETQVLRGHHLAYSGDAQRQVQACNSCHGPDGSGVPNAAPYLAGQSSGYLVIALNSFKTGTRKNDGGQLMRSVAKRLTDVDITAVSSYFAQAGAAHVAPTSMLRRSP